MLIPFQSYFSLFAMLTQLLFLIIAEVPLTRCINTLLLIISEVSLGRVNYSILVRVIFELGVIVSTNLHNAGKGVKSWGRLTIGFEYIQRVANCFKLHIFSGSSVMLLLQKLKY